jgi:TonB family protein
MRYFASSFVTLCLYSALFAQSDASKQSQPASGNAESNAAAQQQSPSQGQPSNPTDSTHLVVKQFKKPKYPAEAQNQQMQGRVWVHITVDEAGNVVSVDPISGEGPLLASAMAAMKEWKFEPYIQNGHPVRVSTKLHYDFAFTEKIRDNAAGDPITTPPASKAPTSADNTANTGTSSDDSTPQRVRISQGVSQGLLVHQVVPVYPDAARRNHVEGTVVLRAVIGKDGLIKNLEVVQSPSDDLGRAAKEAVEQWRYRSFTIKGEPVEVDTTINVNFKLKR